MIRVNANYHWTEMTSGVFMFFLGHRGKTTI